MRLQASGDRLVGAWAPEARMEARERRESGLRASAVERSRSAVEAQHHYGDAIAACLDVQRPRDHNARVQQLCGIAVPVERGFALVGLSFAPVADTVAPFWQLYYFGHDALVAALELVNVAHACPELLDRLGFPGIARAAGQLGEAVKLSRAPILTNQVEYHPFIDQTPVLEAAHALGISVTAFSPLAQGQVFDSDVLKEIGEAYGKSPAQVVMRWFTQQPGVIAIPRSSSPEHLEANNDIHDFELTAEEMGRITALKANDQRLIDPSWAPEWDRAA